MYKKTLGIISLIFSLVLSPTLFADDWGCGEGLKQMIDSMELSSSQKEQIKPIMEKLNSSAKEIGIQMDALDKQLNQQIDSDKINEATVDDLIDKKATLIGQMIKAKVKAKTEIFSKLDAAQKTQLKDKMNALEDKISAKFKQCHQKD